MKKKKPRINYEIGNKKWYKFLFIFKGIFIIEINEWKRFQPLKWGKKTTKNRSKFESVDKS